VRRRSDFGAGFLPSPSLEGGLDELCGSDAIHRSNSAMHSACSAIVTAWAAIVSAWVDTSSFNSTTSVARSSYEGGGGAEDTRSTYRTTVTTPRHVTAARERS
jgi:hypothetical protein